MAGFTVVDSETMMATHFVYLMQVQSASSSATRNNNWSFPVIAIEVDQWSHPNVRDLSVIRKSIETTGANKYHRSDLITDELGSDSAPDPGAADDPCTEAAEVAPAVKKWPARLPAGS